jgi:hypothetical protein
VLGDSAEPEGPARAEQESRVDILRVSDDALLEQVPDLVGDRLERRLEDLVAGLRTPLADGDLDLALGVVGEGLREGEAIRVGRVEGLEDVVGDAGADIWRSTEGAIGRPSRRIASSASSGSVPRSSASRTTAIRRVRTRLTTKAGASCTSTGRLRSCSAKDQAVARARSSVSGMRTSSTSGSSATGLKKWMPRSAPISETERLDVFVARTASGSVCSRSSAKTRFLVSSSSKTASSTRSQSPKCS